MAPSIGATGVDRDTAGCESVAATPPQGRCRKTDSPEGHQADRGRLRHGVDLDRIARIDRAVAASTIRGDERVDKRVSRTILCRGGRLSQVAVPTQTDRRPRPIRRSWRERQAREGKGVTVIRADVDLRRRRKERAWQALGYSTHFQHKLRKQAESFVDEMLVAHVQRVLLQHAPEGRTIVLLTGECCSIAALCCSDRDGMQVMAMVTMAGQAFWK